MHTAICRHRLFCFLLASIANRRNTFRYSNTVFYHPNFNPFSDNRFALSPNIS